MEGVMTAAPVVANASDAALAMRGKSILVKIKKGIELEFVRCPAGTFTMGNTESANPITGEKSFTTTPDNLEYKHEVTITRPFWMSKYPITVEQFGAFCPIGKAFEDRNGKQGEPKSPVCLCIKDVEDFCKWLNRRFVSALPRKCIFRLPTDAEWEYAFCANSTYGDDPYVRFHNGQRKALQEICGTKFPVPVGTVGKPNAWGLYDMLGNGCHYVLDTISSEDFTQDACYGCVIREKLKCGYKESESDPLRLYVPKDNETKAHHLMRGGSYAFWARKKGPAMMNRMVECGEINRSSDRPDRPRIWTFRLVIGPDLIAEKKAGKGN
jgi:formylglycine-generating enzyme required for sulfatase activity